MGDSRDGAAVASSSWVTCAAFAGVLDGAGIGEGVEDGAIVSVGAGSSVSGVGLGIAGLVVGVAVSQANVY